MWDLVDKIALQKIAEVSRDLVIISDQTGNIIYGNELFYRRMGFELEDIKLGRLRAAQLYEGGTKEAAIVTRQLRTSGLVENYRCRLRGANPKNLIDVNLTLIGIPPGNPKSSWIIGINKDIFELERLLNEVGKMNEDEELREFVNDPENVVLCLSDRAGRIFYSNRQAVDLLGYTLEEFIGSYVRDYFWGGVDEARKLISPILKQKKDSSQSAELNWYESSLKNKDEKPIPIRIAYRLYYSDNGGTNEISSILGISQEIAHIRKIGFISYDSDDKLLVRPFRDALEHLGVNTWLDDSDIKVADQIPSKIAKGVQDADFFFFCMTPNAVTSKWCRDELNQALMHEKESNIKIVPIRLESCEIPPELKNRKYADFSRSPSKGLLDLISLIRTDLKDDAIVMALKALLIQ